MRIVNTMKSIAVALLVVVGLSACVPMLDDMWRTMTFAKEESGIDVDVLVKFTNLGQRADVVRDGTVVRGRLVSITGEVRRDDSTNKVTLKEATVMFNTLVTTLYEIEAAWSSVDSDEAVSFRITEAVPTSVLRNAISIGLSITYSYQPH